MDNIAIYFRSLRSTLSLSAMLCFYRGRRLSSGNRGESFSGAGLCSFALPYKNFLRSVREQSVKLRNKVFNRIGNDDRRAVLS